MATTRDEYRRDFIGQLANFRFTALRWRTMRIMRQRGMTAHRASGTGRCRLDDGMNAVAFAFAAEWVRRSAWLHQAEASPQVISLHPPARDRR